MIDKIMVVDDEPTVVRSMKAVLRPKGYDVIGANSGRECLDALDRENVDAVFLDIKMPEMDGIEVLKNVKRMKPQVYVIILTAYATVDTAVEAMKLGAFDYIRKPFKITELRDSVHNILQDIKFKTEHKAVNQFVGSTRNCFETFKKLICDDAKGICITSKNPETINKKYELKDVINVWLTGKKKKENKYICIDPKKLDELKSIIYDFITGKHNTVILIHNLDYLLRQNSLDAIRKFIYWLNKKNVCLILSADLKEIGIKDLTEIENLISDLHIYAISEAISSPLRRSIVSSLDGHDKCSFTEIAGELGMKSLPKLSFHLRHLKQKGAIRQDDEKNYFLTASGKDAAMILKNLEKGKSEILKNVMWIPMKDL